MATARPRQGRATAAGSPCFRPGVRAAGSSTRRPRYGARVGVTAAGRTPTTNLGTADPALTVDPYALVDARVWARVPVPQGALRLSLDVNNLLDRKVLLYGNSGGFFPAAERHLYLGLRYTLP